LLNGSIIVVKRCDFRSSLQEVLSRAAKMHQGIPKIVSTIPVDARYSRYNVHWLHGNVSAKVRPSRRLGAPRPSSAVIRTLKPTTARLLFNLEMSRGKNKEYSELS
jgi:hypothetical protein